jgi:hypothetical protein
LTPRKIGKRWITKTIKKLDNKTEDKHAAVRKTIVYKQSMKEHETKDIKICHRKNIV